MITKIKFFILSCLILTAFTLFSAEIHVAIEEGDLGKVKELLESDNSNLELKNERQFTPLNWAAAQGNYEIFRYLLEQGADLETVDIDGSNLLINAAAGGNLEMIRFLVEEKDFDINFADNNGITPFYLSCGTGDLEVIKYFVEHGADTKVRSAIGGTPIVSAIYSGSLEVFQYLLDLGCEYNVPNQWLVAPVHYTAYLGQTEMLKILMAKGVDIFAETMNRETPFIWAVVGRRFETADFLLANGEDINRKLSGGITPAFSAYKILPESMDYLVGKNADFTVVDSTGNTILHRTFMMNNVETVLRLIELGLDVNAVNNDGITALTNACYNDSIKILQVLLDNGAKVVAGNCLHESSCTGNLTPLHQCVNLGKADFLKLLLDHVESVDLPDEFQRTPLHLAAVRGQKDIVKMLLAEGADINAKDCYKHTPLYYSRKYAHADLAAFLEEQKAESDKLEKKFRQNLLTESLNQDEAVIYFLNHSGWAIKTANNLLIIDYWSRGTAPEQACLANGWIDPQEIKDFNVTVLVSHDHNDHYDPVIWSWREQIPNIRYIVGMELPDQEDYEVIEARTCREYDNLKITAFESNDSGVGFVIEADQVTIFHPGDHANEFRDFSGTFWPEIEFVKEKFPRIDISMMPISGCGLPDVESVRLGVIRTLQELQPKVFLPMHSIDEGHRYRNFIQNLKEEGIKKTRLYFPLDRGDRFVYKNGKLL